MLNRSQDVSGGRRRTNIWIVRVARLAAIAGLMAGAAIAQGGEATPLDEAAALHELTDFSPAGMNRRFGPDYNSYHPEGTPADFPDIYLVPAKHVPAEADQQSSGWKGRTYQLGGPWTADGGDFSSTQGQVIYVPDHKLTVDSKTHMPNDGVGVDRVTIIEMSNNCFTEKPEAPWWGGFRPDPSSKEWVAQSGNKLGMPIALARGMGNWANCGLVLFSSGYIGVGGTATGHSTNPYFILPPEKVPTAMSITNHNEFALVTVTDTKEKKGQVAVFALGANGKRVAMPHDWVDEYPGLANVASFVSIKLLGYIDLPGMRFPTAVSAVGDHTGRS